MVKIVVYAKTTREARKFYRHKPGDTVAHRSFKDFDKPEKADKVLFATPNVEIEAAYEKAAEEKKKK